MAAAEMINPQTRGGGNRIIMVKQSVCISGSYDLHSACAHPTRVLQATVTWPCLFIELVSWQLTSNVFTADELRVLSNKHDFYCVFCHVWVLPAVSLCPSCRFAGSTELHNQSHGSSAPHRPAGPLRHHYLRHHRPGALHGQDAQDLLSQSLRYTLSLHHARAHRAALSCRCVIRHVRLHATLECSGNVWSVCGEQVCEDVFSCKDPNTRTFRLK